MRRLLLLEAHRDSDVFVIVDVMVDEVNEDEDGALAVVGLPVEPFGDSGDGVQYFAKIWPRQSRNWSF